MRFAGMRMENYMDPNRPDMGGLASAGDTRQTQEINAQNEAEAYVGSTGIKTQGAVEAAGIIADAKAGLAQAQGNAAMMEGIGGIASSALGAFKPSVGSSGGGSSIGMAWDSSGVDTTSAYSGDFKVGGQDFGSFLSNPTFKW